MMTIILLKCLRLKLSKQLLMLNWRVSTRDIQKTMQEMYGIDVDDSRVSRITDKLLPFITMSVKTVLLQKSCICRYWCGFRSKKAALVIWLGTSESSKYWLSILNGLKNRGVQDILIVSVDGLSGFVQAINVAFPQTEVQRCVIHQIRASTRYVSYKDVKQFTADLKPIYKTPTEEAALFALVELEISVRRKILES